jgi:hypothetical protein
MAQISPEGLRAVEEIAHRTGFSPDAVSTMLMSVIAGRGRMAQFNHPEFGGSGQWMGGGAIMISDMFNNTLKARVDALCNELSALVQHEPGIATTGSFQSQSQGSRGDFGGGSSILLADPEVGGNNWWPDELGAPSSTGAQNEIRYAYFPAAHRLVIDLKGKVIVYDTQDHEIRGFSQQQPGSGSISFSSQLGSVDVSRLPIVPDPKRTETSPEPIRKLDSHQGTVISKAASGGGDILAAIERLADLHAQGILTAEEFSAKKAELLMRL